jgi:hypothetical protein
MNSTPLETAPAPLGRFARIGLSALLALLAAYEAWDAYMFFANIGLAQTGSGFSGALTKIYVLTHPVFAVVAFLFALAGRVRFAVMALVGVVLGRWLWYLPGPNGSLDSKNLYVLWQPTMMLLVVPPLCAAGALALAKADRLLGLATLLVAVPIIYSNYEMALFAIAVTLFGF